MVQKFGPGGRNSHVSRQCIPGRSCSVRKESPRGRQAETGQLECSYMQIASIFIDGDTGYNTGCSIAMRPENRWILQEKFSCYMRSNGIRWKNKQWTFIRSLYFPRTDCVWSTAAHTECLNNTALIRAALLCQSSETQMERNIFTESKRWHFDEIIQL